MQIHLPGIYAANLRGDYLLRPSARYLAASSQTRAHSAYPNAYAWPPLPAATWEAELNKMNKTFGAAIPDESTQKILAYLKAHYSVENRKR